MLEKLDSAGHGWELVFDDIESLPDLVRGHGHRGQGAAVIMMRLEPHGLLQGIVVIALRHPLHRDLGQAGQV